MKPRSKRSTYRIWPWAVGKKSKNLDLALEFDRETRQYVRTPSKSLWRRIVEVFRRL